MTARGASHHVVSHRRVNYNRAHEWQKQVMAEQLFRAAVCHGICFAILALRVPIFIWELHVSRVQIRISPRLTFRVTARQITDHVSPRNYYQSMYDEEGCARAEHVDASELPCHVTLSRRKTRLQEEFTSQLENRASHISPS